MKMYHLAPLLIYTRHNVYIRDFPKDTKELISKSLYCTLIDTNLVWVHVCVSLHTETYDKSTKFIIIV